MPPYVPQAALAPPEVPESQQFLLVEDGFIMKSSSLTEQGARRAYAQGIIHTVQEGDSLEKLAQGYEISVQTIQWANPSIGDKPIRPGQELLILPVDGVLHKVSRGQTLLGIAEIYGIDSGKIAEQNKIAGSFIMTGQELIIPGGKPIVKKPTIAATPPGTKPTPAKPTPAKPAQPSGGIKPAPADAPTAEISEYALQMPCEDCFITQYYRAGHYALDIQERGGGPIYAAEAGTVIRAETGWNGGYGNVIEIDHGDGLVTLYGHNKELYVKEGDTVTRGQNISWMGNTGLVYGKTGIHVHFEVHQNGVKKNPLLYIQ